VGGDGVLTSDRLVMYGSLPDDVDRAVVSLVEAMHDFVRAVRRVHPEVPEVVTLPTSVGRRGTHAFFAPERWTVNNEIVGEIAIGSEFLNEGSEQVAVCLLHEVVHAANEALGVRDTSRNGTYHNKAFAMRAIEFGLHVRQHPVVGHTTPELRPEVFERYGPELKALREALVLTLRTGARGNSQPGDGDSDAESTTTGEHRDNSNVSAICNFESSLGRPRCLRMARRAFEMGAVMCDICGSEFNEATR